MEPLLDLLTGRFRSPRDNDKAQVLCARKGVQVLQADSGQAGDFFVGKEFLARLDPDHAWTFALVAS